MTDSIEPQDFYDLKTVGSLFPIDFCKKHQKEELANQAKKICATLLKDRGHPVVISAGNEKGGCGKTTLIILLAQLFANMGLSVKVFDLDHTKAAELINEARGKAVRNYLTEMHNHVVNEQDKLKDVLHIKNNEIDPLFEVESLDNSMLTPNSLLEKIEKSGVDIVFIDSAGHKAQQICNFSIAGLHDFGRSNHLISYLSDLILVPSQKTTTDLRISLGFLFPLEEFLIKMRRFKKSLKQVNTQVLLVPNIVQTTSSAVVDRDYQALVSQLDTQPTSEVFYSKKIINTVGVRDAIETFFTTNVSKNAIQNIFKLAEELIEKLGNTYEIELDLSQE